jgi:cytochrome c
VTGAISLISAGAADAGNPEAGEKVFKRLCSTCHTIEAGKNRVGPSLAGIFGRKAASIEGFKYSESMKASNITWTEDKLDAYITDPKTVVPKGTMAFVGLKKDTDRVDVIAYLKEKAK